MNTQILEQILKEAMARTIDECIAVAMKEAKWYWDREEWQSADAIHRVVHQLERKKQNVK